MLSNCEMSEGKLPDQSSDRAAAAPMHYASQPLGAGNTSFSKVNKQE